MSNDNDSNTKSPSYFKKYAKALHALSGKTLVCPKCEQTLPQPSLEEQVNSDLKSGRLVYICDHCQYQWDVFPKFQTIETGFTNLNSNILREITVTFTLHKDAAYKFELKQADIPTLEQHGMAPNCFDGLDPLMLLTLAQAFENSFRPFLDLPILDFITWKQTQTTRLYTLRSDRIIKRLNTFIGRERAYCLVCGRSLGYIRKSRIKFLQRIMQLKCDRCLI